MTARKNPDDPPRKSPEPPDPVSVYCEGDIPQGLPQSQRALLLRLLKGPASGIQMAKTEAGQHYRPHLVTLTEVVRNLCEYDDGRAALISQDGHTMVVSDKGDPMVALSTATQGALFGMVLALLLAIARPAHAMPPMPTRADHLAYMPMVARGAAFRAPTRTPTARPTIQPLPPMPTPLIVRPATYEELRRAVAVPGAYVVPMPGPYCLSRNLKLAHHVTLDGDNQATIVGRTVELYEADGATVRNIRIVDAAGDGLRVSHTKSALIEHVHVSGSGDGEIDIVEGPDDGNVFVTVRDSSIGPGRKCMLLGDPDQAQDARLVVVLERVAFNDCHVRTPKVHWAFVEMRDSTVYHWTGPRIDAQLGARVRLKGNTWIAGPESLPGDYLTTGGRVEDLGGNTYRPWRGAQ